MERLKNKSGIGVLILALFIMAPTYESVNHDFQEILNRVRELKKPNPTTGEPSCKNIILATDLDDTAMKGSTVNDVYLNRAIRNSDVVLPALAEIPGVTTIALTARPVVFADSQTMTNQNLAKKAIAAAEGNREWFRGQKGTDWHEISATEIDLSVTPPNSGPHGAFMSDLHEAFQKPEGGSFESHFNFPDRGSKYWLGSTQGTGLERLELSEKDGQEWVKLRKFEDAGFLVGYWNGVLMTSEQPKGPILKQFLAEQKAAHPNDPRFDFDCVLFADDAKRHIESVKTHLEDDVSHLILLHFEKPWVIGSPTSSGANPSASDGLIKPATAPVASVVTSVTAPQSGSAASSAGTK